MKTVCSLISPVVAFMNCARTKIGAAYVMSFSLHSSIVELRRRAQVGVGRVELELQLSWPVKSSIGLMSAKVSARPRSQEPLERVALDGDEIGQGQDFVEVGERKTLRGAGP